MRSRWFELGRVDKGVTLLGLTVGSAGILVWINFIANGFLSSQGGSGYLITPQEIFTIVSVMILVPLLSALGLLLLPLKAEKRGILSFVSLLGSILAMLLPLFFQFVFQIPPPLQLAS